MPPAWPARLPFYYGWIIIGVAFVTMAISVSARTAFSLFMPPMIQEFGWDRGLASGAFSFGFFVSGAASPLVGRLMDTRGPRFVIECGVVVLASGLLLGSLIQAPWHLYVTLGLMVGVGVNLMAYTSHSLFLPLWFERRRGFAISIAFSGAGVGALVILPWLQGIILAEGWRHACVVMGLIVLVVAPLNLLVRRKPEELGLAPDGDATGVGAAPRKPGLEVVDADWAAVDWTLARAARTARFWWLVVGFIGSTYAWYAVQVHQTTYLAEVGFSDRKSVV